MSKYIIIFLVFSVCCLEQAVSDNSQEASEMVSSVTSFEVPVRKDITLPSLIPNDSLASTCFENIQVLEHLNNTELQRWMVFFTESLKVKCQFCHSPQNYTLDENNHKEIAREMIQMVQDLNKNIFKEDKITCYTCHGGEKHPVRVPEWIEEPSPLNPWEKDIELNKTLINVEQLQQQDNDQIRDTMTFFTEAIGVFSCGYCHNTDDYSSDNEPSKLKARSMIKMSQDLNKEVFRKEEVSCYTCHKGSLSPESYPKGWKKE